MKLFILLLSLTSFPASADMFKCKDANGKVSYQEQPCQAGSKAGAVKLKDSASGTSIVSGKEMEKGSQLSDKWKTDRTETEKQAKIEAAKPKEKQEPTIKQAQERKFLEPGITTDELFSRVGQPDRTKDEGFVVSNKVAKKMQLLTYYPAAGEGQTIMYVKVIGDVVTDIRREISK